MSTQKDAYTAAEQRYSDIVDANRRTEFEYWSNFVLPKLAQLLAVEPDALGTTSLSDKPWSTDT